MTPAADWVRLAFVTVLGSGFAPFASGTWGSLVSVVLYAGLCGIAHVAGGGRPLLETAVVVGVLAGSAIGIACGPWAVSRFGRSDPKPFVLDEFAGQWLSLLYVPVSLNGGWWSFGVVVGLQFLLFRGFDIAKLSPAREAEHLPHGWGIVTDDLVAGVYANIAGQLIWRLSPAAGWLGVTLST